jgi:hypothetical protein
MRTIKNQKVKCEKPVGRNYEAIGRTSQGEIERYCVRNVLSIQEAREELLFQVRNLKTVLFRVQP